MKGFIKGISVTLAGLIALSSASFAWSPRVDTRGKEIRNLTTPNDLFVSDFSTAASFEETGWTASVPAGCSIGLAKTKGENGKMRQALLISDNVPGTVNTGGVITRNIGEHTSGTLSIEMKFKMELPSNEETDFASNGLYFMTSKNAWATRFYVLGDKTGGGLNWAGDGSSGGWGKIQANTWYTATIDADLSGKKIDVLVRSDALQGGFKIISGLTFLADFLGMETPAINSVKFESRMFTADWYIDYIRVTKDYPLIEKPKAQRPDASLYITPPTSPTPVMRPVPYSVNVNRDGIYKYFDGAPQVSEGKVYVTPRSAFRAFGFVTAIAEDTYKAAKGEAVIEMKTDGSSLKVNGKTVADAVSVIGNKVLVSLNDIAAALGETAEYKADEQTLYINSKEAAE